MKNLATAVVAAMAFLELSDSNTVDEDAAAKVLEELVSILQGASKDEQHALLLATLEEASHARGEQRKFYNRFYDTYVEPPKEKPAAPVKTRTSPDQRALLKQLDVHTGDAAVVARLLKKNPALATTPFPDGDYPLHLASLYGHTEIVKMLLAAGAKCSDRNAQGDTPLHLAALNGNNPVVRLLLKAGADVNARNTVKKETPLAVTLDYCLDGSGHKATARLLKEHGGKR